MLWIRVSSWCQKQRVITVDVLLFSLFWKKWKKLKSDMTRKKRLGVGTNCSVLLKYLRTPSQKHQWKYMNYPINTNVLIIVVLSRRSQDSQSKGAGCDSHLQLWPYRSRVVHVLLLGHCCWRGYYWEHIWWQRWPRYYSSGSWSDWRRGNTECTLKET